MHTIKGGLCGQKHIALFILFRIIAGLGVGAVSSIGPLYVGLFLFIIIVI
jgi:hypothetical protein